MTILTRRRLLAGAAVTAVAASSAVGAVVGATRPRTHKYTAPAQLPTAPEPLRAALAREQALLAGLGLAMAADATQQAALAPLLADHRAHLSALNAALAGYASATPSATPSDSSAPVPAPPTREELIAAEKQALAAGQAQAATLSAQYAALFASIAACEAGHVALLS